MQLQNGSSRVRNLFVAIFAWHPMAAFLWIQNTNCNCHSNDEDPERDAVGNDKIANSTLRLKCIHSSCLELQVRLL